MMKIDGRMPLRQYHLHCGNRSRKRWVMPLHGLPDLIGFCFSHECSRKQGNISLGGRTTENLCKDCRKRR